jgi:hypothetical protein
MTDGGRKLGDATKGAPLNPPLSSAARDRRRSHLVSRCLLVGLLVLVSVSCLASAASADVDMTGRLEKIPALKSAPGEVKPLATSANGEYRCADPYSVVGNWYYYFAIGNCAAGWDIEVVSYASENSETHEHSYGGFVNSAFSGCGWIDTRFPVEKLNSNGYSACAGGGSSREFKVEESSFMEKYDSSNKSHDGNWVVNKTPCPEYANYRPWSTNNVEKELIRTVPAYAAEAPGYNTPALKWRYTTKYASTDGTGQYVMVRDDRIAGGEGNWVFVPRSCLPATLPENESERNPPAPAVTTDGASGVGTTNATVNANVNPNGVATNYFFEYGTTEGYGSYTTTREAGAGTGNVPVSAEITGLAPYTTYYFRIVASSAIGEVFGGPVAFKTQAVPPTVTTGAATVQFRRATLNGTVNPNGAPTEYHYQYGLTSSYGSETSSVNAGSGSGPIAAPATVTGLEPGTTYHFRIVASNPGGTNYGGEETFTTAAPPVLSISNRLQSSMTLMWTASTNASSYTIKRNGATVGSGPGLTYVDTKLNATTFYSYEIIANDESESAGSNTVTRATTPLDTVEADVTGNGKTDLVYLYPGGYIDTFLSHGNGTYEGKQQLISKEFDSTSGLWLTGDVTGNGRDDLIYIYPGGYIDTFLSNGNGTYEEKSELIEKGFDSTGGTWEVGNFSGNGKADLVYIFPGGYIETFLSNGNGTYERKVESLPGFSTTSGQWFTGDFNGNGKTDLAYVVPGSYIDTFFSNGNGTYEGKSESLPGFDSGSGQWFTGDFNGNGKTDLVYIYPGSYFDTFFSNGNGTYEEKTETLSGFDSGSGQWLTGDASGNGKTDLFYIYPGSYLETFLSNGNGTYEGKAEYLKGFDSGSGHWRTGDANDNGKTDLFYIYPGAFIDTFFSKGNGTFEGTAESLEGFEVMSGLWL